MASNKSKKYLSSWGVFRQMGRVGIAAMIVATVAVIVAGYLANLPAVLLGDIVDRIVLDGAVDDIWPIFVLIVACLVARVALVIVQKYLVERTAVGVQKRAFLGNLDRVLQARVDALQSMRVGEVNSRLEKRVHGTIRLLKLVFLQAIPQLSIAVPALGLAFFESVIAGTVMLVVLILSIALTAWQIVSQKGIRIALIDKTSSLAGHVAELLSHLDFVRAAGMSRRVKHRFEDETEALRAVEFTHHKWMMGFDAGKGLIEDAGLALIVAVAIFQVIAGDMTPGTILALAMLYKSAALPLQNLHRIVDELHESALQIDAAAAVLKADPDPALDGQCHPELVTDGPLVAVDGLSLTRVSSESEPIRVLDQVSFEIYSGEVIGIAGPSGGGKTTLLKTLLGLLPDYEGSCQVFGAEVRNLDKELFADTISYAPQRPFLRQGDLLTNVSDAVVRTGTLPNDVVAQALSRAQLDFTLSKKIAERGDNISPGQAQRLSLARVFAKSEAQLVILDEATSMLDGATQAELIQELRLHAEGRALVMVAHRLDTLKWADRILVLDEGRIVQMDTYRNLASVPGAFSKLIGQDAHQIAAE